jgi:hypothetical protein
MTMANSLKSCDEYDAHVGAGALHELALSEQSEPKGPAERSSSAAVSCLLNENYHSDALSFREAQLRGIPGAGTVESRNSREAAQE